MSHTKSALLFLLALLGCSPCGSERYEIVTNCILIGPKGSYYNEIDSIRYFYYDAYNIVNKQLYWSNQELKDSALNNQIVTYCTCSELKLKFSK